MADSKMEYEEVYKTYSDRIMGLIRSKVNNREDAEDLHSSVFIKVFEKYETFDPSKASISTWIYTIANNMVIDYYRVHKVHEDIDDNYDLASEGDDYEAILQEETLQELAEALEKLDQRGRDIIILRYYEKMTLKEVAVKMGMSYSNCKLLHNKALVELKNLISF